MTNREFFVAISTAEVADELKQFALDSIAKLDARNAKRSSQPSKTAIANEPIKQAILCYLEDHAEAVASDIAVACEVTTQKASALCRQLVDERKVISIDKKVPKKGKVKAYSLAIEEIAEDTEEVEG